MKYRPEDLRKVRVVFEIPNPSGGTGSASSSTTSGSGSTPNPLTPLAGPGGAGYKKSEDSDLEESLNHSIFEMRSPGKDAGKWIDDTPWPGPTGDGGGEEPPPIIDDFGEPGAGDDEKDEEIIIGTGEASPEEMLRQWEKIVKANIGIMPTGIKDYVEEVFSKPVVNWRIALTRLVSKRSRQVKYHLPNRRFVSSGKYIYGAKPVKEGGGNETVVIIIDTSGSMSEIALQRASDDAVAILQKIKPKETYVLWCDTTVHEPVDIITGKGDYPKLKKAYGGGGTSFLAPFEWIQKNLLGKKKMGTVVYFTDGYPTAGGWPKINDYGIKDYADKVVWGITSEGSPWRGYGNEEPMASGGVPFGTKIDVIINGDEV